MAKRKIFDKGKNCGRKGFVYTIEVLLAIFLVAVTITSLFLQVPEKPQGDIAITKRLGIETLEYLDNKDVLRNYVNSNDAAGIERELDALLPNRLNSNATICERSCTFSGLPVDRNVIVADYYVSGYRTTYLGKKVRVFMWSR